MTTRLVVASCRHDGTDPSSPPARTTRRARSSDDTSILHPVALGRRRRVVQDLDHRAGT